MPGEGCAQKSRRRERSAVALRAQFRAVALCALCFEFLLLIVGILTRHWTIQSLFVYLIIWSGLMWWTSSFAGAFRHILPVFWDSLVCGRPAYVALRSSGLSLSPISIAYLAFVLPNAFRGLALGGKGEFPVGSVGELVFCCVALIVLILVNLARRTTLEGTEHRLAFDMRSVAAQPRPEPSDPRYKHWKSGEHFPEMLTDMLVSRVLQQVEKEKTRTANSIISRKAKT